MRVHDDNQRLRFDVTLKPMGLTESTSLITTKTVAFLLILSLFLIIIPPFLPPLPPPPASLLLLPLLLMVLLIILAFSPSNKPSLAVETFEA
ncbi:unnamed protein product [Cochlearia groenlandica]